MIEEVSVEHPVSLDDYASYSHLEADVAELRSAAATLSPQLRGRTVWMVNSTARGGGVAEMMPRLVSLLNQLGVRTKWVVIGTHRSEFFGLTKRLHNLIHGEGQPAFTAGERDLYETVSRELADEMQHLVAPGDLLVVHDPQPAGMGAMVQQRSEVRSVWRSHIGLDEDLPQTRAAWDFLQPYVASYDHTVFTASEYIPSFLSGNVSIITPAIDPIGDKNRAFAAHTLAGILCNSGLMTAHTPVVRPSFEFRAERLQPNGCFASATTPDEIGLLFRPVVTQISRWDRLKGWMPLMQAFVKLKCALHHATGLTEIQRRRLQLVRLVLAGPEPASVQDDPEATSILQELCEAYVGLDSEVQQQIVLLSLPMKSRRENALMVNALQHCSSVVVQNSLQEGFGLTVTEPMWKRIPVLGSNTCGIRQQIRDGVDGRLIHDPQDADVIARTMVDMLGDPASRERLARQGQRRVHDDFLVFTQLRRWLEVLVSTVGRESQPPPQPDWL